MRTSIKFVFQITLFSSVLIACSSAPKSIPEQVRAPAQAIVQLAVLEPPTAYQRPAGIPVGPIDDCMMNTHLYSRLEGLNSECTLNYVHFFPATPPEPAAPTNELHIGSYNMFHLGDNQSAAKNLTVMANLANRWDIIAAQEFMPIPSEWSSNNKNIYQLMVVRRDHVKFPYEDWTVVKPGYLALLQELRKIDPSWALILQSQPAGEGSTGEMAGFYYRSSFVHLKEWNYCPPERSQDLKSHGPVRNLGCLVQIPKGKQRLISRTAFAAYFQAGDFDFVGLTAHIRFRAPGKEEIKKQQAELCASAPNGWNCKFSADEIGRFYEVKAVADQIAQIQHGAKDADVIYMGDFNLELKDGNQARWRSALANAKGFQPFQSELTTLSVLGRGLASNYDHFIFNPSVTTACDLESIRAVSLLPQPTAPDRVDIFRPEVMKSLTPDGVEVMKQQYLANYDRLVRFQKSKDGGDIRGLNEKEKTKYSDSTRRAITRMKANEVGGMMELLSDHLPIEMTCKIGTALTN